MSSRERLLVLMQILLECGQSSQTLDLEALLTRLSLEGYVADRRAIYADLKAINDYTDLQVTYDASARAYRVEREGLLDWQQLAMLERAILAARFISPSDKQTFIKRFSDMTGYQRSKAVADMVLLEHGRQDRKQTDLVYNTAKTLQEAMQRNQKVQFDYVKPTSEGGYGVAMSGCRVSVYLDLWYEDRYYVLGSFDEKTISHYRVERIRNPVLLNERRVPLGSILGHHRGFQLTDYLKKNVGLSRGSEDVVMIRFQEAALTDVVDRFGDDVVLTQNEDQTFTLHARLLVNKKLKKWILGLGSDAQVLKPDGLAVEIADALTRAAEAYR